LSKKIDFIVVEGIRREESRFRQNTETFEIKKEKINKQVFEIKKLYPIAYWDTKRVFEYIASKGIDVNPLYKKGFSRVGCMPCIYANKYEILNLPEKYKQRVRDLEEMMNKEYLKKRTNYITFFESGRQKFLNSRSLFEEAE
jgi:3'-phosphoadenosine 5'-phosphosulfate sulfotransferase (PAPS reductase)/FAD synthetase